MLVPFVIDANSLAPDTAWTPAEQRNCHESLLKTWQRIGLLVHDGATFEDSRIKQAIGKLPQKLLPLWQELLERLPIVAGLPAWDGVAANNASCLDALCEVVRLALVEDARAESEFGMDDDALYTMMASHPQFEICRLLAAERASSFNSGIDRAGQHIRSGETYADLWRQRFRSLAKAPIKQIAIVDRYAVSRHFKCDRHQLSGLARFLRLLDDDASGQRYVTLFSALPDQKNISLSDVRSEIGELIARLPKREIRQVTTVILPDYEFGIAHHDRFVRFGEYVWDIGRGLEVFEGAAVSANSQAAFKTGLQIATYKNAETALHAHPRAKNFKINL